MTKATKVTWECPKCKGRVTTHIPPVNPPSCENYTVHKNRNYVEMIDISTKEPTE